MLTREIRRDHGGEGPVVMMLTSGDRPSDMGECERLGIGAYLLKPVKQSELLEAIELALGILGKRRPSGAEHQRIRGRSLRVLLAEDSLVNQQLVLALLEGEGHVVAVTNNGREAVAAAAEGSFDVVLMDLQMPEMDGLEATAAIRANERSSGRHLPIIAMTAHALKGDRERCLEAGMDGYTSKPIDVEELFAAIDSLAPCAADADPGAIGPGADLPASAGHPPGAAVDWSVARRGSAATSGCRKRSSRPPCAKSPASWTKSAAPSRPATRPPSAWLPTRSKDRSVISDRSPPWSRSCGWRRWAKTAPWKACRRSWPLLSLP